MSKLFRGGSSGPRLIGIPPEDIGKPGADRIEHITHSTEKDKPKRQTKKERLRDELMATMESAREFAESKPSRKALREYFERRITQLNDPYAE